MGIVKVNRGMETPYNRRPLQLAVPCRPRAMKAGRDVCRCSIALLQAFRDSNVSSRMRYLINHKSGDHLTVGPPVHEAPYLLNDMFCMAAMRDGS
jgi:hypothetical protein